MLACDRLVAAHADLAGIVVLHGTASLEETAYVLGLTLKVDLPVVVVGSQRPASALSTDAGMNLANAIRTAASPEARGMGVLVLLNDEIHAAREVTKTSTFRLQTFRSPDFGVLGHADGDAVAFYRRPIRKTAPDTDLRHPRARRPAARGHRLCLHGLRWNGGQGLRGGRGQRHHIRRFRARSSRALPISRR